MEWLKNAMGEEAYNALPKEAIESLSKSLGSKKFIEDDKGKFIEKHVFNQQREELKQLKSQVLEYEKELENRKDLITSDEHKLKLLETENNFKAKLKELEDQHKQENEINLKKNSLISALTSAGAMNPEFILNNINLDDAILKDGKIQNINDIVDNMKKNVPVLFNNIESNPPNVGNSNTTTKESLIKDYESNINTGNIAQAMAIQRKIKELEQK